jgi:hypothetical protein
MTKDRELDDIGHICDMTNDDAVDTLHSLISMARSVLGVPDRPDGDDADVHGTLEEKESDNASRLEPS